MGRIRIGLGLVSIVLVCSACTQKGSEAVVGNVQQNAEKAVISTAPVAAKSNVGQGDLTIVKGIDQIFVSTGRQSLTVDAQANGSMTTIIYGQFSRAIPASSTDYIVANYLYPGEKTEDISKGEYGVVIMPKQPSAKLTVLVTGEAEIFKVVDKSDETAPCWKPRGAEKGVHIAQETAGGILFFRHGWKWENCGD